MLAIGYVGRGYKRDRKANNQWPLCLCESVCVVNGWLVTSPQHEGGQVEGLDVFHALCVALERQVETAQSTPTSQSTPRTYGKI